MAFNHNHNVRILNKSNPESKERNRGNTDANEIMHDDFCILEFM